MANKIQVSPSYKKPVETDRKRNKKVLSLFLAMIPSLILAGDYGLSFFGNVILKGLVLFWQFVVIKNILDDYYSYID